MLKDPVQNRNRSPARARIPTPTNPEDKDDYRTVTEPINIHMKIAEVVTQKSEAKAPEKLCKSRIPDDQLGASQLASCKSQGLRARDSGDSYTIGGKVVKLRNKKIRGKKYGGPLPAHGKKNKANARKGKA